MTENLVSRDNESEFIKEETVISENHENVNSSLTGINTKPEIISKIKELLLLPVDTVKEDVEVLKQSYFRVLKQDMEAAKQLYIQANETLEGFNNPADDTEDAFKEVIEEYKQKKAALNESQNQTRQDNLQQKLDILSKMNEIIEATQSFCNCL